MLKSVIDKYNDTLIAVYIDLTAAYDHMPRNFPFKVLDLRTGASHLIAILYKMCRGATASFFGMKERFELKYCSAVDNEVKSHHIYSITISITFWRLLHEKLTRNFRMAGVLNSYLISHISAQIENSGKVAD